MTCSKSSKRLIINLEKNLKSSFVSVLQESRGWFCVRGKEFKYVMSKDRRTGKIGKWKYHNIWTSKHLIIERLILFNFCQKRSQTAVIRKKFKTTLIR